MYDYEELLNRAMSKMPDTETTDARFVIPEPKLFSEGKTTILDNFGNIADTLNRDPDHLMKYLTRETGDCREDRRHTCSLPGQVYKSSAFRQYSGIC